MIPLGLAGGLVVALACCRVAHRGWGMIVAIDLFRAVPPLVLLILIYSGLPFAGIRLSPTAAVALPFSSTPRATTARSIAPASRALAAANGRRRGPRALTRWETLAFVVLPQAVRNVLPDLVSNTVEVVKLTSIASVVSFPELLYSADMARSLTFNSSPVVLAATIYLVLLWPLVRLISRLERGVATH